MSSVRPLFFSSGLAPEYGGAAISEASLCQALLRQTSLKVACRQDRWNRKFVRDFGIQNILEFRPADFYQAWKQADHPIRSWFKDVDVVHLNGHWRWEYYFISRICGELSIPYVLHPRGMMLVGGRKHQLKRMFNWGIGREIAKNAQKVIALSQFETKQLCPYDLPNQDVIVIPNGVCSQREVYASHYQSTVSDHFLYFGRIEHRKNLLFLLEAFDQYRKLGGTKKLRLKGPVEHGYEVLVNKKIDSLKLNHHVSLLAPSYGKEKWRHLSQAVAVLYPCLDEPFGRVPFEALLSGSLPIVPQESGGAEYLEPILPDLVYPTHEVRDLAMRLLKVEKLAEPERNQMLELGRRWVRENLDWEKVTHQICGLYESAILESSTDRRSKLSRNRLFGLFSLNRLGHR